MGSRPVPAGRPAGEPAGDEGTGARAVDLVDGEIGLTGEQQEQEQRAQVRLGRMRQEGHGALQFVRKARREGRVEHPVSRRRSHWRFRAACDPRDPAEQTRVTGRG